MICPLCSAGVDAEHGSTLDWEEMVRRAHRIIHEPPAYSGLEFLRRDIAGVVVALSIKLAAQAPRKESP